MAMDYDLWWKLYKRFGAPAYVTEYLAINREHHGTKTARNRATSDNVDEQGRFLDPAELRRAFSELGIDGGEQVGAYCGSGVSAAHQVLALELAGYPAALYAGSWSGWITDPSRPVARGPE